MKKFTFLDSRRPRKASLTRRMVVVAAIWISILLAAGGVALDRVLTTANNRKIDAHHD